VEGVAGLLAAFLAATLLSAQSAPKRIVSLIPAVTETLFAIGAGPQVVAVSSFDRYPPGVKGLPRVGALVDPDLEKILSLRPDLVAVFGSQTDLRAQLARAEVPVYLYDHGSLADVTPMIRAVGARVGRTEAAERLARQIEVKLDETRKRVNGRPRPRTLIVFGREALALRGIYASGAFGFINDIVSAAGGDNVFADMKQQAVQATAELILSRRPEVILELRPEGLTAEEVRREQAVWNALASVPAVRNKRVYILTDARTVVPGPRIAEGADLIAKVLHPFQQQRQP
jgi:iron complex transport system substrate-binding protein